MGTQPRSEAKEKGLTRDQILDVISCAELLDTLRTPELARSRITGDDDDHLSTLGGFQVRNHQVLSEWVSASIRKIEALRLSMPKVKKMQKLNYI